MKRFNHSGSYSSARLRSVYWWSLIIASVFFSLTMSAAPEPVEETPAPLMPIALADIPTRASSEQAALDQAMQLLERSSALDEIEKDLLGLERDMARDLVSLSPALANSSSRGAIAEIEKNWLNLDRMLEAAENELYKRTSILQVQLDQLDTKLAVWKLTIKEAQDAKGPDEIVLLARTTTDDIAKTHQSLRSMQDRALALQAKAGRARSGVKESIDRIKADEASLVSNLLRRERPALWDETITDTTPQQLFSKASAEWKKWTSSILGVINAQTDRLVFQLMLFGILAMFLRRSRRAARAWSEADPDIAKGMSVFERPFALALLLVLILTPFLYAFTPTAVSDAVGLLLVLPVLWLILPIFETGTRPALLGFAGLYVLDQIRDLLEAAPLVSRLLFILEMLAAIAILLWLLRSRFWREDQDQLTGHELPTKRLQSFKSIKPFNSLRQFGFNLALFLLGLATLLAITGYVRLAVILGTAVLNSIFLGLLLIALKRTAEAIIRLLLHSDLGQMINVLKGRSHLVQDWSSKILKIVGVFAWIYFTLDFFAVRDVVGTTTHNLLFTDLRAGAIGFSLSDILAFVITIAASILLSRFIVAVLDEDVYPRANLGRGVSFAISSVVKYLIILVGFFVAIGAMGIGLDKITLLLGAFGIGLGFGLQTIVNNFFSGLILIFERPVQIGDSVEVGSVSGLITRIGIRSSTVRSFDGADITVPNGTLLSEALTNWTMTDRNRRIEIPVGVAYGTDPDTVIKLLNNAVNAQEGLLKNPAPQILFEGFGENSLDFLVRTWVEEFDEFVSIKSSLALGMNRELRENNIEIPFPQRDIHIRTSDPDVNIEATQ